MTGPPRHLRRAWIIPAAVVVAGALALLPSVGDDEPGPGEAEVRVDGIATVVRADGGTDVVAGAVVRIGPGDTIEVTAGQAHFALAGAVAFEGRAGPAGPDRRGTTVAMDRVPELVAGPLLVVAPRAVALRVAGSEVAVAPAGSGDGVARLDRRLGLGVGTYAGSVAVRSAGRSAPVVPLRRVEVATPGALGPDLPLEYSAGDAWDRRYLAGALHVDGQLGPLLTAYDAVTGPGPATVGELRRARPGLPRGGLGPLVAATPTRSGALVTAVLADLGSEGSFPDRVEAIARFRDDGAPWGLVTLDQGVAPDDLLRQVRAAIDRLGPDLRAAGAPATDTEVLAAAPVVPDTVAPPPRGGGAPPTSPPAPGGGAPDPGPGPSAPPAGPPADPPPPLPGPVGSLPVPLPPLPDPGGAVDEVVDGVGGAVDGALDGVGGTVDGVVEGLGAVVEDLGQDLGSLLGDVVDGLLGPVVGALGIGTPPPAR